jgi:hypothetical protein
MPETKVELNTEAGALVRRVGSGICRSYRHSGQEEERRQQRHKRNVQTTAGNENLSLHAASPPSGSPPLRPSQQSGEEIGKSSFCHDRAERVASQSILSDGSG